jgi:putative addiction module CopG family antidote
MTVNIPAEFAPLVQSLIASGQFGSEHEVVAYALRLLQAANEQEQQLIQDVRAGFAEVDRGEGLPGREALARLQHRAEEIARSAQS